MIGDNGAVPETSEMHASANGMTATTNPTLLRILGLRYALIAVGLNSSANVEVSLRAIHS